MVSDGEEHSISYVFANPVHQFLHHSENVDVEKMGICVVDNSAQRIGIGRSVVRLTVKFLPWELAHFGIWQLILPSTISAITIYIILSTVYIAILVYLITSFTNKKRKMFMIG